VDATWLVRGGRATPLRQNVGAIFAADALSRGVAAPADDADGPSAAATNIADATRAATKKPRMNTKKGSHTF
jgi:hypothetical protein